MGARDLMTIEHLFGLDCVRNALLSNRRHLYKLLAYHNPETQKSGDVDDILRLGQSRAVPVQFATRVELDRLTDGRPHQNVVLAVSPFAPPVISAPPALSAPPTASTTARPGLWIALAGLLDPQNVGSIIRTAFYYNCVGLVSPLRNTCDFTPIVSKASAGTMEIFDHLYRTKSLSQYIKNAKHAGFTILGTGLHVEGRDEKRDSPRRRLNPQTEPIILLLGGEGRGLSPDLLALCDENVVIDGVKASDASATHLDSLNVSVAAGILIDRLHH